VNFGCAFFSGSVILFGMFLYFKELFRRKRFPDQGEDELTDNGFDLSKSFYPPLFLIVLISFIISFFSDEWYQFTIFFTSMLLIVKSMYGYSAGSSKESIAKNPIPMIIVSLTEFLFPAYLMSEWTK